MINNPQVGRVVQVWCAEACATHPLPFDAAAFHGALCRIVRIDQFGALTRYFVENRNGAQVQVDLSLLRDPSGEEARRFCSELRQRQSDFDVYWFAREGNSAGSCSWSGDRSKSQRPAMKPDHLIAYCRHAMESSLGALATDGGHDLAWATMAMNASEPLRSALARVVRYLETPP